MLFIKRLEAKSNFALRIQRRDENLLHNQLTNSSSENIETKSFSVEIELK